MNIKNDQGHRPRSVKNCQKQTRRPQPLVSTRFHKDELTNKHPTFKKKGLAIRLLIPWASEPKVPKTKTKHKIINCPTCQEWPGTAKRTSACEKDKKNKAGQQMKPELTQIINLHSSLWPWPGTTKRTSACETGNRNKADQQMKTKLTHRLNLDKSMWPTPAQNSTYGLVSKSKLGEGGVN